MVCFNNKKVNDQCKVSLKFTSSDNIECRCCLILACPLELKLNAGPLDPEAVFTVLLVFGFLSRSGIGVSLDRFAGG